MNREEIIRELAYMIRRSQDAIVALEAQAAAHRPEYERICTAHGEVDRIRMVELYPYVVGCPRAVQQLRKDAEVLAEAHELLAVDQHFDDVLGQ